MRLRNLTTKDTKLQDQFYRSTIEGKNDVTAVSTRKKTPQTKLHREISRLLGEAVRLNLHNRDEEVSLDFGTRINVGEFVTGLSKYYGIELSSK